jgi:hypothetical protein
MTRLRATMRAAAPFAGRDLRAAGKVRVHAFRMAPGMFRKQMAGDVLSLDLQFFPSRDFSAIAAARSFTVPQSIHEPPDPDVHHQAQRQKHEQGGRTAVTHQRKRYSGHWHESDDHRHVD